MQIVAPSRCSSRSRSITASPFFESRFPVGSSASRIDGLAAQRAGHGDALLLTAGKLGGQCFARWAMPTRSSAFIDALPSVPATHAAIGQRQLDVLKHGEVANEIEALENEPDLSLRIARALAKARFGHRLIVERVGASRGRIEQPEIDSNVDLPQPDGPAMDTYSPGDLSGGFRKACVSTSSVKKTFRVREMDQRGRGVFIVAPFSGLVPAIVLRMRSNKSCAEAVFPRESPGPKLDDSGPFPLNSVLAVHKDDRVP